MPAEIWEFVGPLGAFVIVVFLFIGHMLKHAQEYLSLIGHRRTERLKNIEYLRELKKYSNHIDGDFIDKMTVTLLHEDIFKVRLSPKEIGNYSKFCIDNELLPSYHTILSLIPDVTIGSDGEIALKSPRKYRIMSVANNGAIYLFLSFSLFSFIHLGLLLFSQKVGSYIIYDLFNGIGCSILALLSIKDREKYGTYARLKEIETKRKALEEGLD